MDNRHFFVTGGAGFIGSRLIAKLVDHNRITVFDSLARDALSSSGLADHENVTVIEGDVCNASDVLRAMPEDTDYVLHMAAIAGVDTVLRDPIRTLEVNVLGTFNTFRAAQEKGIFDRIRRLVFFSTSEVLGRNAFQMDELADTRLAAVGDARWTYAVGKLAGEHLAMAYHHMHALPVVSVRPFNVYGPGQIGEGAIHHFVRSAVAGEDLIIHGDGDQIRAWCHVSDVVAGILACVEHSSAIGQVFNIGNPRGTITVLELAKKIRNLADSNSEIIHVPKPYVDVDLRVPRVDKARELLDFEPRVELEDGLSQTIDWYRRRGAA